jgi:hypothetical protein
MRHVLVITDNFTRYTIAVPTKTKNAEEAAQVLLEKFS